MTKTEINNIQSSDVNIEEVTPVMQQYLKIRRETPDCVLLYRLGDFYETFFEDAIFLAKELELTLTGKEVGGTLGRIPLAGIPVKSLDGYLEKLVEKNYRVAICEQLEDPKTAKGLVDRGVVRIVTAGTLTETTLLEKNKNNYLCAVFHDKKTDLYGFAYTDISTGEFKAVQMPLSLLLSELARIKPTEIIGAKIAQKLMPFQIVPEEKVDLPDEIIKNYNCSKVPPRVFEEDFAENNLKAVFKTDSLDALGWQEKKIALRTSAALLAYIWENMKEGFPKFERIELYEMTDFVQIDLATRKNLELTETLREKNKYGSLLWAIDKTKTNMGARHLRSILCQPLKNAEDILKRQNIVAELVENNSVRNALGEGLENIYDIQRLSTRLSNNSANPRDFLSLKQSLFALPKLLKATSSLKSDLFTKIKEYKTDFEELASVIERTIKEDTPLALKEGGIIKDGVSGELDYFKDLLTGGEKWLTEFEEQEREATGIKTLKVGYNKVFGFFIEITNSYLDQAPETYIRKQTLTGGERFITQELKKHEDDVLSAQFKARELEYKLYCDFREYAKEFVTKIREIADEIANADTFYSLAKVAVENNYVRPIIDESDDFIVKNGRHAVLEKILPLGEYVANDIELSIADTSKTAFMILTGPNMAGKSTYMRQNALIAILAQIGSFVPADYAKIGVVDKIFTRVGASDDLTLGQSTFMVEMVETAFILNSATSKSLILLDEIGRGTSTYDGVAIAWAVAEFITMKLNARCIFATHYHELNVMTLTYPQIKNYRITITENNGEIEFLRKVVQGGASKSYGVQVAKMAGLPESIVKRSMELLTKMQKNSANLATRKRQELEAEVPQLNLF